MDTGLSGKVALVVGRQQGPRPRDRRIVRRRGASLAICARGEEALAKARDAIGRTATAPVHAVAADLSRLDGIERVVRSTLERFGRVDVLVTNAGGPPVGLFDTLDWNAWQRAVDLTLRSAVEMTRAVLPGMRERRWGRVIHVTSLTVKQPIDGLMLSTSIRSAVTGFSRTLANEVAAQGITVNTILPGFMNTERVVELNEATAAREGVGGRGGGASHPRADPDAPDRRAARAGGARHVPRVGARLLHHRPVDRRGWRLDSRAALGWAREGRLRRWLRRSSLRSI